MSLRWKNSKLRGFSTSSYRSECKSNTRSKDREKEFTILGYGYGWQKMMIWVEVEAVVEVEVEVEAEVEEVQEEDWVSVGLLVSTCELDSLFLDRVRTPVPPRTRVGCVENQSWGQCGMSLMVPRADYHVGPTCAHSSNGGVFQIYEWDLRKCKF